MSALVLAFIKIGKYYRTTVPREVRNILGLKENDEIEWVLDNGKIIIRKASGERS